MTFTVYSKPACPHCEQAKSLLKSKGLDYQEIILDVGQIKVAEAKYITREELLVKIPTARTMPQIFAETTHIGGFSDLKTYLG